MKQLLAFAVLAAFTLSCASLGADKCSDGTPLFDPSTLHCEACPGQTVFMDGACRCELGFAMQTDPMSGAVTCTDCASRNMAVSTVFLSRNGSQHCVACGGDTQLACLTDATYNPSTGRCTCPEGSTVAERVGALALTAQMCAPCPDGQCSAAACTYPYVPIQGVVGSTVGGFAPSCTCADGFTMLYDGSCVPTAEYDSVASAAPVGAAAMSVRLLNENGNGGTGAAKLVQMVQTDAVGAAVLCGRGNMTACQYLSNMCVIMQYNTESVPCALYLRIKQMNGCTDEYCEKPSNLPWLYYTRSTVDAVDNTDYTIRALAQSDLQFVVSTFDLAGSWRGFWLLQDQVNLCRLPNTEFETFMQAGGTRKATCRRSWKWFLTASATEFYELYLINPQNRSELVPVPAIVEYSNYNFEPKDVYDKWLARPPGNYGDGTPSSTGLRRRFYAYDNVGGVNAGDTPAAPKLTYLASLWAVSIVLGNIEKRDNALWTPVLVLQYSTKDGSLLDTELPSSDSTALRSVSELPLTKEKGDHSFAAETKSFFLADSRPVQRGLMITLIIMSSLCFISAWVSTYGWMRRRQNHVLDVEAFIRFFVHLCSHISNTYTLVVAISSWYVLVSYKSQHWLDIPLHFEEVYLNAMLYTAVVTKAVAVVYKLVEQCNANYFVVDWERSKGQLLRENKVVPVSMWRSTFLANELNELQGLRYWHPLLTMCIIFLFLVGLGYENLSLSVPHGSRGEDPTATSVESLRIAVDTFFWIAVALVMYLLEFQIFYRFIVVHPLQAFVDLCSVSNISLIILPERQFGYYIHGESIHAHADVSMEEFQTNLFLESQGNLPVRGLGGQSKCQTFEMYVGPYTHQYLNICYVEIAIENTKAGGKGARIANPMRWHYFDCFSTLSRKPQVFSKVTLAIKDRINHAFQQSVRHAEGTLLVKFVLQKWFGFPPNVMYMNGPHHGENGGRDLFFFDDVLSYGKAFMCGIDFDLFILYATLFAAIDSSLHNVYAAMVLTFVVEIVFWWYRRNEGVANMSKKTLIDSRFFL